MELINELRRSQSPDILQAIRFLASTGIRFSPLLECIITELMEEDGESERPRETRDFSDDVELGLLENDERMNDGSIRGLPALNPRVGIESQGELDIPLESALFSMLEEASVEERFRRL